MRDTWGLLGVLILAQGVGLAHAQQIQPLMPPAQLVREVVYNELHDHDQHGYWRYWIEPNTRGNAVGGTGGDRRGARRSR